MTRYYLTKLAIDERDAALALTAGELLQNNYQSAVAVLESEDWDDPTKCPTCEAKQPTSLLESLLAKLKAYEDAETAGGKIKTAWQTGTWVKRLRDLEANERVKPAGEARDHGRLATSFTAGSATRGQFNEAKTALAKLEQSRLDAISSLGDEIANLEKSLPASMVQVTTQVTTAKQAAADLASYEQRRPQLSLVRRRIARREAWQSFIQTAYGDFSEAESTWVSNRQAAIATDYQEMHDEITRNPDVVPSLDRPSTSERLRLGLDRFYGLEDLSATPLLQESYCNAVAISTFLSTALLCPTPARFIVLDDITSSFDGGHQFNLMELLRTRIVPSATANGLQIILLTHDTLLEKYLNKATQTGNWRHQKLIGTPPNGPVLTEQHNKDRVRQRAVDFLAAGQIESASPWIRQYLEATLTKLIRKTGIRVPLDYAMDDTKKTPQNALDAIADEIDLHTRAGTLVLTEQQAADTTNTLVPSLVSNFLAHYNTGAFAGITSHVLLGVLNDIDALADCFKYDCTCRQPGQTVRRFYRSLTAKACGC